MKRASGGKRSSKSKSPNKGRTFLNRPIPLNTGQSKSRSFANRPASSNTVKPQKRLLTHCSESRLQNQSKGRLLNRLSPSKTVRPQNRLHNDSDGYKLGEGTINIKQEHPEIPEATEEEELVAIDFDINGQTISAKMSSTMVQLLNEDDILREQIIEKLVMENAANPGGNVIIKEPSNSSDHELPDLNTSEPGTSSEQAKAVGEVNGQDYTKSKKRVRIGAPVGNRSVAPIVKHGSTPQDGIYSMWGDETVVTFLEAYEATKQELHLKQPSTQHFWKTVCKQMKRKGYIRLTDKECQKKFESMEAKYREQVEQGITAQTATWEYFNTMKFLLNDNFKTKPLVPVVTLPSKPIVDATASPMYESDGASSSDEAGLTSDEDVTNGMNFSDLTNEPPHKKEKISTSEETSEVELLRRTYLSVETKKLKEMKAMRKLQKQQSRLQAERNILLSSIVDLLRKNSIQVKKR